MHVVGSHFQQVGLYWEHFFLLHLLQSGTLLICTAWVLYQIHVSHPAHGYIDDNSIPVTQRRKHKDWKVLYRRSFWLSRLLSVVCSAEYSRASSAILCNRFEGITIKHFSAITSLALNEGNWNDWPLWRPWVYLTAAGFSLPALAQQHWYSSSEIKTSSFTKEMWVNRERLDWCHGGKMDTPDAKGRITGIYLNNNMWLQALTRIFAWQRYNSWLVLFPPSSNFY